MGKLSLKRLTELAIVSSGNSAPQREDSFANGLYPFFRTSDAGRIHIGMIESSVDRLNKKGIKGLKLFPKGTILFPKSGASTFLNHRVMLGVDGYVSSHLATIVADEELLNKFFLFYFLRTIDAKNLVQESKYPSLKVSDIEVIEIPFPPLPEQKRIVKILDEVFVGIEKAKENTEKNLRNLRELFEACLRETFQNNHTWEKKLLGDAVKWKGGGTPTTTNASYWNGNIPWVSPKDMKTKNVVDSIDHISEIAIQHSATSLIPVGSVLIVVRSGILARTIPIAVSRAPLTLNQDMKALVPDSDLDTDFLYYILLNAERSLLSFVTKGATVHRLQTETLKNLEIPIPSMAKQKEIVMRLDALSVQTKKLEALYKQKLSDLDELKKSVLKKAFSGEL